MARGRSSDREITAWSMPDGVVHFRNDIYSLDGLDQMATALGAPGDGLGPLRCSGGPLPAGARRAAPISAPLQPAEREEVGSDVSDKQGQAGDRCQPAGQSVDVVAVGLTEAPDDETNADTDRMEHRGGDHESQGVGDA